MKIKLAILGCWLFVMSCGNKQETTPSSIVSQSVQAHGGLNAWHKLTTIRYKKRTVLYEKDGQVASDISQWHEYMLQPELIGKITWVDGMDSITIIAENDTWRYFTNNKEVIAESPKAKETFLAAYYTLCQPFKLLDEGASMSYLGKDTLEAGRAVNVIKVEYPNATKSDTWWYYFDEASHVLLTNMVDHGKGFSYIVNLEYDYTTPIVFNRHRKSYTADSERNIQFLRAEYFNTDFEVVFGNKGESK